MQMNESIENYLERILMLYERKGYARSIDIAEELGVTKPSVSHATKIMRENGYISMDASNYITLTEKGREIAEKMYEGVDEKTAFADACKIEHDISDESFRAICSHAERQRA